jgi:hypothetical protein
MVLIRDRRAKRPDAIAHDLIDGAPRVMDGVHHQRRTGSRILRASSGSRSASAVAREVGEQDGDLLAFAPERGLDVRIFWARCFGV